MILSADTSSRSLGFLGPAGTFTEEALVTRKDLAAMKRQPFNSMLQVLKSVESGVVDVGFVLGEQGRHRPDV